MELHTLTLTEASEKLKNKEISSRELTDDCISRIEETEPSINALLATNFEMARSEADLSDKRRANAGTVGLIDGIPCTIKDILLTKGLTTTAASIMLRNYTPLYDATSVRLLREAGTVILGKNNLDAWAHGGSTENSDFGPSKNPWDLERVPGGSSGGSAASVAADQCLYSIGTDTGGSIRQPASLCGVVGLKPTYGRVSRFGSVAMGSSLDCIGPITKTVSDAALILKVIAGKDQKDATTTNEQVPDYFAALNDVAKKIRVAVPRQIYGIMADETKIPFDNALDVLRKLGATIDEIDMPMLEYGIATYYIIMSSEVSSNLGRYDGIRYGYRDKEADGLLDTYLRSRSKGFGDEAKRRIMMGTYVLSAGYYDAYYKKAMRVRTLIKEEFEQIFNSYDVIATPTTIGPAFKIGEKADDPLTMYLEDIFTVTANIAGIPGISVPSGLVGGLPVGFQLLAKQYDEARLLQIAHAFERENPIERKIVV